MKERPATLHMPKPDICEDSLELRHAVTRALGLPNGADWTPMPMGKTNNVWSVTVKGQTLVVKWFTGNATPMFDNDPFAEFACLTRLAPRFAPQPVLFLSGTYGRAVVYRYLSGPTWSADTASVGRLLRDVHSLKRVPGLPERVNGSEAVLASAKAILSTCRHAPRRLQKLIDRIAVAPTVAPLPVEGLRLLHGDPVASNIVETPDGLRLIDWQSPAWGDPCDDLAVFLSPSMQLEYRGVILSDDAREAFLAAYDDPDVCARYRRLSPLLHLRLAAYAQWGLERGRNHHDKGMDAELDAAERALAG